MRYVVDKVGSDTLKLRKDGVRDVPVTVDNQSDYDATKADKLGLPDLACVPRRGITYELRADGWLVIGSRSGAGTSRPRNDVGCTPWSVQDPAQAGRLVEPELAEKDGKKVALPTCEFGDEEGIDIAATFVQRPYGGGTPAALSGYANAVFSGRLLPGCSRSDKLAVPPHLLPSIRDMSWTFGVSSGFSPRPTSIGVLGVAMVSHPKLGYVYAIDQGAGSLHAVGIADGTVRQTLE